MLNRARGEVPLLIEGVEHRLCLTLGALAEIEAGLTPRRFRALESGGADITVADVIAILTALLRGGGHDVSVAQVSGMRVDLAAAVAAIEDAFAGLK